MARKDRLTPDEDEFTVTRPEDQADPTVAHSPTPDDADDDHEGHAESAR